MIRHSSIADIIKSYVRLAGVKGAEVSGHSLRSGFMTSALEAGAEPYRVQDTTRHKCIETLRAYDKRVNVLKDHAGVGFL